MGGGGGKTVLPLEQAMQPIKYLVVCVCSMQLVKENKSIVFLSLTFKQAIQPMMMCTECTVTQNWSDQFCPLQEDLSV